MKKKAAGFFLALTMIASVMGCGKTPEQAGVDSVVSKSEPALTQSVEETPSPVITEDAESSIYLIIPTEVGLSAQEEAEVITGARKEGYQVTVRTYENDIEKMKAAFDEAVEANASVIICDNIDNNATTESVEKAKDAGISTILMNKGIEGTGMAAAQILTDRYVCISRLAGLFAEKTGKISNYAFIYTADDTDMSDDIQSFSEALVPYESMKNIAQTDVDEYNIEAIKESIRQLLAEKPEINALVCANGVQAHAATDVCEEMGSEMIIICLDGDDEVSTRVLSGKIYASIVKPAKDLGVTAFNDAVALLKTGTTGTNERMYYAGVILTTNEIVTVVSPTPTATPAPGTTESPADNSDLSSIEVEIPDSTETVSGETTESISEEATEDTSDYTEEDTGEDVSENNEDLPIEIVDVENYDDGGEGTPDMQ